MMIWSESVAAPAERRPNWLGRLAWVTWRQHRATLIGIGLVVAVTAAVLLRDGLRIRAGGVNPVPAYYRGLLELGLPLVTVVIGMFLGAPLLAREYADRTASFAWTQDAGRLRPVLTKVLLIGVALLAAGAIIGWLTQWSAQPLAGRVGAGFDGWEPDLFDATPVTEASLTLLSYAAGLLAGVVSRRVVPAMAATAAVLLGFLLLGYDRLYYWLVGHGLHRSQDLALAHGAPDPMNADGTVLLHQITGIGTPGPAGSWLDQGRYLGPGGHPVSGDIAARLSYNPGLIAKMHATFWVTYQPGNRYGLFQSVQGGGELLIALLLGALAVWLVQRRNA